MRILVTGASGLLGINLCLALSDEHQITGLVHRQKIINAPFGVLTGDLCDDSFLKAVMEKAKPQLVINCAAAANIDWCEQNPDEALLINSEVPGRLAEICLKKDINLLHISTDAVFDGKQVEYTEEDIPNPQSVYARSKLLGEQNVVLANQNALISRVNFYDSVSAVPAVWQNFSSITYPQAKL